MALPTIIASNQTVGAISLDRLGLTVPASGTLELTLYAFVDEIKNDDSLHQAVVNDEILLDFGQGELTKGESLKFFGVVTQEVRIQVRALSNADISPISGVGQTVDTSVTLVADDRVLLTNQTPASENGVWVVKSGAWERPDDFATDTSVSGALVFVAEGDVYAGQLWNCTSLLGSDIVGTSSLSFDAVTGTAGVADLQGAYEGGHTITTSTGEGGAVAITTTADNATGGLTVTSGAHTGAISTDLVVFTTTSLATGEALEIVNAGTGTGLLLNNTSTGNALDVQDSGSSVVLVDGAGAVSLTPTSGQNATITTAGSGTVDIDAAAGGVTIDATAGPVSIGTTTSGDIDITSAGATDIQSTNAVTIDSSGGAITIGGDADTGDINIGTGGSVRAITIGNTTAGTSILIDNHTTINGNLDVQGTTTSIDSTVVNIADNYLYLNKDYTTASGVTGGIFANYLPTSNTETTTTGGFATTATVNVPNTTITFTAGDIIQVSGAADPANDGIYEVVSHTGGVLTIDSTPTEDFSQTTFTVDTTDTTATVTQVGVSVLRQNGSTGDWEIGIGNTVPLTYDPIVLDSDLNAHGLQEAYVVGNTITTSGGEGNVTITGTEDLIVTTSDVDIDTTATVTIDASTSIAIGGDADTSSIDIGTGAAARTVTIGNNTGATGVVIDSGTEQVEVDGVTYYGVSAGAPTATTSGFQQGDKYYDTNLDMEMRYDGSNWLSVESVIFQWGRDGNVQTGTYFRASDGRVMSSTLGFVAPHAGQIVAIGFSRTDTDSVILEVVEDGTLREATAATTATSYTETNSTGQFSAGGVLGVRNAAASSNTVSNVIGWFKVKWRV